MGPPSRASGARGRIAWILLVAATLMVLGSLLATRAIRNQSRTLSSDALALVNLETKALEFGQVEKGLLVAASPDRVVAETSELGQARATFLRTDRSVSAALSPYQRTVLRTSSSSYLIVVDRITALVAQGDIPRAQSLDQAQEAPAFDRLDQTLKSMSNSSLVRADQDRRNADRSLLLILGITGLGVAALAGTAGIARRRAERAAAAAQATSLSEARFRALVEHGDDVTLVTDARGRILQASDSAGRALGSPLETIVGSRLDGMAHPDEAASISAALARVGSEPAGFVTRVEWRWRCGDGGWRDYESSVANLLGYPEVAGIVFNARDVTDRLRLEGELRHRAFHDSLTGLANQALLQDRTAQAMARRHSGEVALLSLDLDGFKALNDSLGHPAGDFALSVVADRLRGATRPEDTAARVGGDEFVVLVDGFSERAEVAALAARLIEVLAEPLIWEGRPVRIGASIGIAFVGPGLHGPADLVRNADIALYAAKAAGRSQVRIFAPAMGDAALTRSTMEADMRRGIEAQEFVLHYQPVVDLDTRRLVGFEALVRWERPGVGLVPPLEFIPVAEAAGLIVDLGRWVLVESCRRAAAWPVEHPGHGPLSVGVNLSALQLRDPAIVADIAGALATSGLDPALLTLEITESVMMTDVEEALGRLQDLKALGLRLAVDDFGTGYSSLSYLRRFPFDTVKIDKSFVDNVVGDGDDADFLQAILALGETLHLQTLAEGIETAEQAEALRALHCRLGQGYHFAKPLDAAALEALLARPPDQLGLVAAWNPGDASRG